MQFVSNGPDVPEELLRFHEEGKVVFFCGAGTSMRAGLPSFKDLVEAIWQDIGYHPSEYEKKLVQEGRCDAALSLLDRTLKDTGPMRHSLTRVLSRYQKNEAATATHKALLTLSKTMRGKPSIRLVTTNFDRIFEDVGEASEWHHNSYVAPFLPVPKQTTWNGVVYLHGLLGKDDDENALTNLVVTSGDFGRAYLKERWAARFVTELFREFVVCFVGYSLDDPVMRYIADAIEADKVQGEKTNPIFMFAPGKSDESLRRGTCITYINYSPEKEHDVLHKTLTEWANTFSGGIYRKANIIDECCDIVAPDHLMDEFYVGRLKWAFADAKGDCAKRFATHNPVPSLKWAPILMSTKRVKTDDEKEDKRPLLSLAEDYSQLDVRQSYFWVWLSRHLDNPDLVWMVLREGDALHPMFHRQLFFALTGRASNCGKGGGNALHPMMYRLWRLILAGHVRSSESKCVWDLDAHHFLDRIRTENLDYLLRQDLRNFLTPAVLLEKILVNNESQNVDGDAANVPKISFDTSLCLRHGSRSGDYFIGKIRELLGSRLSEAFDAIEFALLDGLENLWYLDPKAETSVAITFEIRSIEEHTQNKQRLEAWGGLIDLLRDTWVELADKDRQKACTAFEQWIASKHSLFQRLALFASKRSDVVPPHTWCQCLLDNDGALLWQVHAQREVARLLATTSLQLSETDFELLATKIAMGPPSSFFKGEENKDDTDLREKAIWLRLTRMTFCGRKLPQAVQNRLDDISGRHPRWGYLPNQREEFLVWSCGTGDPDFEEEIQHIAVPEQLDAMVTWLIKDMDQPERAFDVDDNWPQVCKGKPARALEGLAILAESKLWNVKRISEALMAWRDPKLLQYGHQLLKERLLACPNGTFVKLAPDISLWCEEAVREKVVSGDFVIQVARRILSMSYKRDKTVKVDSPYGDPIADAINHPVGRITEALLDSCFDKTIQNGEGIPSLYQALFSEICTASGPDKRAGRVILVSRIVGLYYADAEWVRQYLYPLLDWDRNFEEARAAWHGFLWVNRPYPPLMAEVKHEFLLTSAHLEDIKLVAKRYCSFLTLLGLWNVPEFSRKDYQAIFASWPVSALEHCANLMRGYQTKWMASNSEKSDEHVSPEQIWGNNVEPFIREIWPKDAQKVTKEICASFSQVIIGTGKKFPDALQALTWVLKACPLEDGWRLHMMKDQTTCLQDFPEASLDFLLLVAKGIKWDVDIVIECLSEIVRVKPALKNDSRYIQLENWAMR